MKVIAPYHSGARRRKEHLAAAVTLNHFGERTAWITTKLNSTWIEVRICVGTESIEQIKSQLVLQLRELVPRIGSPLVGETVEYLTNAYRLPAQSLLTATALQS